MIKIYTTPSCASCRKAKKWFDDYKIPYEEKKLFATQLTKQDIYLMLENADNGYEDIISTRSKIFLEQNLKVEDMSVNEINDFIIKNPSVLRRPIIIDDKKMQVGYNEEEIRIFVPKRLRELIMCCELKEDAECTYKEALEQYFKEIAA